MSKINLQITGHPKIWLGVILWILSASTLWAEWHSEIIATFPGQYLCPITIGAGRNDDTIRIYVVVNDTASYPALPRFRTVKELTYAKSGWYISPVCSLASIKVGTMPAITLADGRNDGTNRLYLTSDSSFYEFTFSTGKWNQTAVVKHSSYLEGLLAACGRNDDTVRLYSSGAEFSFSGDNWISNNIPMTPAFAGVGRNDDTVRFYEWDGEWTYQRNDSWILAQDTTLRFRMNVWTSGLGDGRNDSIIRIYGTGIDTVIGTSQWECSFSQGVWKREIVDKNGLAGWFAGIGDGKNSGKNQIYFPSGPNEGLFVYEWQDDHWDKSFIPIPLSSLDGQPKLLGSFVVNQNLILVIGEGRSDDTNRIYFLGIQTQRIIEITWVPESISEPSQSANGKPSSIFVYPNPSRGKAIIHCSTSFPAEIYIYNSIGQLIRKYIKTEAGNTIFFWDSKDWFKKTSGEGIYFCVLKSNSGIKVKKIVLLN